MDHHQRKGNEYTLEMDHHHQRKGHESTLEMDHNLRAGDESTLEIDLRRININWARP